MSSFLSTSLRGALSPASSTSPPPPSSSPSPSPMSVLESTTPLSPTRTKQVIDALKKVPDLLDARATTLDELTPCLVRLLASHSPEVKTQACEMVVRAAGEPGKNGKPSWEASHPEIGLLALGVLRKDLADPNPDVRITAVSALSRLRILAEDHAADAVLSALRDSNPRVRRAGVASCASLNSHSPSVVRDRAIVDSLYAQIKDPDPTVVTFAMQTVNEVLEDEGGIVVPNSMAKYLVKRLADFPNFELCFVLDFLKDHFCRRKESSDQVRLLVLNAVDHHLVSDDGQIFLSSARLCQRAVSTMAEVQEAVMADFAVRVRPQVLKFMKPSAQPTAQEFQVELLKFVVTVEAKHWLAATPPSMVAAESGSGNNGSNNALWVIRVKDSSSLKRWKLRVAAHLVTDERAAAQVFDYLCRLMRKDPGGCKDAAVAHLCHLLKRFPVAEYRSPVVRELTRAVKEEPDSFSALALKFVREIGGEVVGGESQVDVVDKEWMELVELALRESILRGDPKVLREALWVLRRHCGGMEQTAPALLEALLDRSGAALRDRESLRQPLVTTGAAVFAANPPAAQAAVGRIFQICFAEERESGGGRQSQESRERAALYSKLLQEQVFVQALRK